MTLTATIIVIDLLLLLQKYLLHHIKECHINKVSIFMCNNTKHNATIAGKVFSIHFCNWVFTNNKGGMAQVKLLFFKNISQRLDSGCFAWNKTDEERVQ